MARTSARKQYKKKGRGRRIATIVIAAVLLLAILAGVLLQVRSSRRAARQEAAEKALQERIVTVTIPEGSTVLDIAAVLEKKGVCSAEDFEAACVSIPEGYERLFDGVTADNRVFVLEGYLFPETYEFYKEDGAEKAVKKLLDQTNKVITDEDIAKAREKGMTLDRVLTLASVIQSEASDPKNMPMVASVFTNRLKEGSGFAYLGSDVTRHYIERKMKGYIAEQGMDYDTLFGAYCTNDGYTNKTAGLPVGPICNVGRSAIDAALNPAESKYYYFFTDNDWNYYYNETLNGHQNQWNQLVAEGKAGATQ
ncbi:MAG: endolytic transglycosylase MltG [Clostridia bacterium]|nr:endolytic transglycosylase MltG [Clostridia bacterium]MBR1703835.1 endolytic transglycosylase MltG [Clostridia bacterium]